MTSETNRGQGSDPTRELFDVAVLGAGPVGVEAAVRSVAEGHRTALVQPEAIGRGPLMWGHVRMFTPWAMNTSPRGRAELERRGYEYPGDDCPTGRELAESYLQPLVAAAAESPLLRHVPQAVEAVRRLGWPKRSGVGSPKRAVAPFVVQLEGGAGQGGSLSAHVVIDCTGTQSPTADDARLEQVAAGHVCIEGLQDWHRSPLSESQPLESRPRPIVVVGGGASAATDLVALAASEPDLHLLTRSPKVFAALPDDPLPERRRLFAAAGDLVESGRVTHHTRLDEIPETATLILDTGRTPEVSLFRDLQVHLCYATEGPMKLAAQLMSEDASRDGEGPVDCLSQSGGDADLLRTTEPGFFVLGSKSYGRRSNFLLRAGIEQVEAAFDTLVPQHLARIAKADQMNPEAERP